MPITEKTQVNNFLDRNYKMTDEMVELHTNRVLRDLDSICKRFPTKNYKKETVLAVAFSPIPLDRNRSIDPLKDFDIVLDYKKPWTLADDKKEYPSIFDNEFVVGIRTNKRTLIFRVYERYRWNNADIWGILQVIAWCSKDDRRVILGSGIHDFMLEYKQELFEKFLLQDPTLTIEDYRWISSDTFKWNINMQGMGPIKSKLMSNLVDFFQKHFQKKKWNIRIPE